MGLNFDRATEGKNVLHISGWVISSRSPVMEYLLPSSVGLLRETKLASGIGLKVSPAPWSSSRLGDNYYLYITRWRSFWPGMLLRLVRLGKAIVT
jgi:hypothetical protein